MRVIARANTGVHLPESYAEHGYYNEYKFPLVVGKSYVVYAMNLWAGKIRYLVIGETNQIPIWIPSELFEIIDSKLSRYWYYGINLDDSKNTIESVWGYKELTDHSDHFDKLVDWDKTALEIFIQYKELMDLEFPDPEISDIAEMIEEGNWLLCKKCCDAFESRSLDAMIRCPNCGTVLGNPRYSV
jgi:hypothetical protein